MYFNGLASQVSFNYSGQKSDAGGYAQVYIDSKVGEPVATINLPVTGDNWSTYTTVSQQLEKSISGLHDIYIVFKNEMCIRDRCSSTSIQTWGILYHVFSDNKFTRP